MHLVSSCSVVSLSHATTHLSHSAGYAGVMAWNGAMHAWYNLQSFV